MEAKVTDQIGGGIGNCRDLALIAITNKMMHAPAFENMALPGWSVTWAYCSVSYFLSQGPVMPTYRGVTNRYTVSLEEKLQVKRKSLNMCYLVDVNCLHLPRWN